MTSALALTLLLAGPASPKGIQWEKDFDTAMKKAEEQNKPILIDFWAEWCGWCHRLDRTTYVDPVVATKALDFVAVKINTEGSRREREVKERYRVYGLPTILFLSPGGLEVARVRSFIGPGELPATMDKVVAVSAWETALARDENDPVALFAIGRHLFDEKYYAESEEYLVRATRHDADRPVEERRESRVRLAMILSAQRRFPEAETVIKEALSLDPTGVDQPNLLFFLGRTYVSWGRREMGMETMQVIVRDHPRSPVAQKAQEILERK